MPVWLARVLPLPLALLLVTSLGVPVSAQRLAFRVDGPASVAYGIVDLATGVATPGTADEAQLGAVFTSDGQYAARAVASGALSVRHMPSGQQTAVASYFVPRLAHPRRHAVFGAVPFLSVARFDERGLVPWEACSSFRAVPPILDLSVDGRSLYVSCPNGDLVGLDTESGAEIRRLAAVGSGGLALNAAATEAVVLRGAGDGLFDVVRLDLATGQALATRRVSSIFGATVASTPDRKRVLLTVSVPLGPEVLSFTELIDAVTLADVRGLASSWRFAGHSAVVSPDGHDAFVVSKALGGGATAAWIDIDTGASRASASVPAGYSLTLGYAPAPLPPVLSPAQVATGTVTLSWALPDVSPMVTGYRVDVGTAPGTDDLGVLALGAGESLTASGVPPGRYFVRVRAVNVNGTSGPSNDVVIDVP